MLGKIVEVFIPNEDNVDVMDSNKIGFKIDIGDDIITLIQEQDEFNTDLFKDDLVEIRKQVIDGKEFVDIVRIGEDSNE